VNFLDLCGAPGSGKSTLADHFWGPHSIPIENRLPPAAWLDFCNEITRLFHLIKPHATFPAALRMVNRSVRKMATVARMAEGPERCGTCGNGVKTTDQGWPHKGADLIACSVHMLGDTQDWYPPNYVCDQWKSKPYIQTGLVQRGLGFGWRLNDMGKDLNEIRHYFELMPVSIGVAVTRCPMDVVEARNHARKLNPRTAHEERSGIARLMEPCIPIAIEVLRERGVPVVEIDTTQPIEAARAQLVEFADRPPSAVAQMVVDCGVSMLSPPPWWQ
jgi:hypothetical protein